MLRVAPKARDLWTDEEFIKAYGDEAKAAQRPVFLGKLQRPDWTGRIPTYLIWCLPCQDGPDGGFTVAHEAGYQRRIECRHCRARYDQLLLGRRVKDTFLNPHRHPFFIVLLLLLAAVGAVAFR